MIVLGIILLIVGAVVASISADRTVRLLGIGAAALGFILIVLDVVDSANVDAVVRLL